MQKHQIFNFITNSYSQFLPQSQDQKTSIPPQDTPQNFVQVNDLQSFNIAEQIYITQKRQSKIHQLIFFSLGLLFLGLASIVYFNTTNWACSIYFSNCVFVKTSIYTICLFLALATLFMAYFINPGKETINYLARRMERKLKELYRCQIQGGGAFSIFDETHRARRLIYKQSYHRAKNKIREHKEQALHVLDRIYRGGQFERVAKEELIQQTLGELHHSLSIALQSYKQRTYLSTINQRLV